MTRIGVVGAGLCCLGAIAGLAALPASPLEMRFRSAPPIETQPSWSETEMANSDHDKVMSAIHAMCDRTPGVVFASQRVTGSPIIPNSRTTFQTAALSYSEELRDQRVKLAKQIEEDRATTWRFQMAIVLFGALATIMIGLKPLCESLHLNFANTAVAAAAIIFSAMVTSLSSLSAVAAGQIDLLHHQRTLAQLQQLHWRIDNDVFAATRLCDADSSDLAKVGSWKDRFEEITSEAMPTVAQPGDLRSIGPAVVSDKGPKPASSHA